MDCWHRQRSESSWPRCVRHYRCWQPILSRPSPHRRSCSACRLRTFCCVLAVGAGGCGWWRCWLRLRDCWIRAARRNRRRQPAGGRRESGGVGPNGCVRAAVATCCKRGARASREAVCACASKVPKGEDNATANGMDCALQRPFNPALASTVCKSRIESLLANRGDVYNPHSDHLAGGLVQQGLSVAVNIAPWIHVEARQINAIRWASQEDHPVSPGILY